MNNHIDERQYFRKIGVDKNYKELEWMKDVKPNYRLLRNIFSRINYIIVAIVFVMELIMALLLKSNGTIQMDLLPLLIKSVIVPTFLNVSIVVASYLIIKKSKINEM